MTDPVPLLETVPPDPTPDAGPEHRGGPFAYFVGLTFGLTALGGGLLLAENGRRGWGAACLVVFGAAAIRSIASLFEHFRHRESLPRLPAVLSDALAFRIHCTCRDVAATVFLDPDRLAAGSATRLLCFVENYASRQRIARFRIGPHPALGLAAAHVVDLHLAAGQAAVYVLPLAVAATLPPGEHDLPVTLQVRKPAGTGVRLPGARRHLYDLWTVHFAAPFTVTGAAAEQPAIPSARPRFLPLASAGEGKLRLDSLQFLGG